MGLRPENLPQVSAPFSYIVNYLDFNNIGYNTQYIKPKDCKPTQSFIDGDTIDYFKNDLTSRDKTIIISMNNDVIDGKHRLAYNKMYNGEKPMKALRIMLGLDDAADILKQIENYWSVEQEKFNDSSVVITGYRSKPLVDGSKSGNFLYLSPKNENDLRFDIKVDNLLRIPQRNLKDYQSFPSLYLAKKMFSTEQIEKDSLLKDIPYEVYINRLAFEYAKSKGYDAVLYGDKIIQLID